VTNKEKKQIHILFRAAIFMTVGLILFKFIPMKIWGNDIVMDASMHITVATFVLYIIWFFIDQNKNWHIPFCITSGLVLVVISLQRILINAHNDIGILLGLILSIGAIVYSQPDKFKNKFKF
jgi:hypothetical protein